MGGRTAATTPGLRDFGLTALILVGCACESDPPVCTENCDDPNSDMVLVPAGEFWMGCNPDLDLACSQLTYSTGLSVGHSRQFSGNGGGRRYPWGDSHPTCDQAVFNLNDKAFATGDCRETTGPEPVGSHPAGASVYGVNDMAGNASEWVADWYAAGYDEAEAHDPRGPTSGEYKVVRGGNYGSWVVSGGGFSLRASIRKALPPASPTTYATGFRCAKSE